MVKIGKTKIGLLDSNDKVICYYRAYVFGGLFNIMSMNPPYANITISCGALKGISMSINLLNGKSITYPELRFKLLRKIIVD